MTVKKKARSRIGPGFIRLDEWNGTGVLGGRPAFLPILYSFSLQRFCCMNSWMVAT